MTQKEKAEAYDKALEAARCIYNNMKDGGNFGGMEDLEVIFPELAEPDDEMIRKELIKGISKTRPNTPFLDTNITREDAIAWFERQRKKKSIDKVETKFKVGDWIIHNDNKHIPLKIIEKIGMYYRTVDTVNYHHNILIYCINENYHLWTIRDAKAGDVLVHNSVLFIFMGIENGIVKGICTELSDTILNFGEPEYDNDYCPATNEQRDLLFKKMREAGYEWDREKKELRKIDWNPQPGDTFRKKGTESPIYHLCDKLEDGIHFGFVEERENVVAGGEISIFALKNEYELVERLKPIEKVIEEELNKITELKPSWSKEDEKFFKTALWHISYSISKGKSTDFHCDTTEWFKSLKDRVQPHKQWKPSEIQKDCIEQIIDGEPYNRSVLIELFNDLKKL